MRSLPVIENAVIWYSEMIEVFVILIIECYPISA